MSLSLSRSLHRALLRRSYGTVQAPPSAASLTANRIPPALQEATAATAPRTNWSREEVQQVYETPLSQLTYAAVGRSHLLPVKAY
jgi:biotin synthase